MPVSELPPPAGYRFNTGINVLPQFRNSPPGIRDLPNNGPTVETPTASYPSSLPPAPTFDTSFGSGPPSQDWRGNASPAYPNMFGNSTDWRDNATYQGNPPQSLFSKIGDLFSGLFNNRGPNSTPPSDTPPGMGGIRPMNPNVYQTGRFNSNPFSQTLAQAMFPGSAIGPGGSSVANPYDPNAPRGPISHDTGLSGTAAAFHSYVTGRNIV